MHSDPYIYFLAALLGLAIGSFLNVLIYRLPREQKVVLERSCCPNCRKRIAFYDNIPVISYLVLLGKCRICNAPISARYPMVEILNAALYVFFIFLDGLTLQLALHWFLASALLVIFFIDLEFQIIPDKITFPGMVIGLIGAFFVETPGIVNALIGFVVGGGALLAVAYLGEWLFKKEAMGGGDIKMAAMMGAFVGWQKVLLIFMGGAVIGMIVSLIWMGMSEKVRKERLIPFGPFLAVAALIIVVYGDSLLSFYINNFLRV
ncbi:MAG: prepilin peptidase [FCB group bacterium]|nr:prepilin peptidase [FCB group bacterium]